MVVLRTSWLVDPTGRIGSSTRPWRASCPERARHLGEQMKTRALVRCAVASAAEAVTLAGAPGVAAVEADAVVTTQVTQSNAPWGLDRIDQRNRPLSTTYSYARTGAGVRAYVIDTGIRFGHSDFGGRAVTGYDAVDGGSADDCNGHGTHVASTLGGATYGVAKGVTLVGVRVLNCSG